MIDTLILLLWAGAVVIFTIVGKVIEGYLREIIGLLEDIRDK